MKLYFRGRSKVPVDFVTVSTLLGIRVCQSGPLFQSFEGSSLRRNLCSQPVRCLQLSAVKEKKLAVTPQGEMYVYRRRPALERLRNPQMNASGSDPLCSITEALHPQFLSVIKGCQETDKVNLFKNKPSIWSEDISREIYLYWEKRKLQRVRKSSARLHMRRYKPLNICWSHSHFELNIISKGRPTSWEDLCHRTLLSPHHRTRYNMLTCIYSVHHQHIDHRISSVKLVLDVKVGDVAETYLRKPVRCLERAMQRDTGMSKSHVRAAAVAR